MQQSCMYSNHTDRSPCILLFRVQVRGSGASKARVDACYCDAELRVMRTHPDGAVFVYRRLN